MVSEFSCNGGKMKTVLKKHKDIEESLEQAYTAAVKVMDEIGSKENWDAESQKTMMAFLTLLTAYHKDFIQGTKAPLPKADKYLEELQEHLGDFYEQWEAYTRLEGVL